MCWALSMLSGEQGLWKRAPFLESACCVVCSARAAELQPEMGHPLPGFIQFKICFCTGSKKSRLITLGASELFQGVCKAPFLLSVFS